MTKPGAKGTIYALSDPRDGTIRYIGKTTQPILDRLAGHLASPTNPAMRVWINSLSALGRVPDINVVATVPLAHLSAEEDQQIRKHARDGHKLLNGPYYQRNLGSLFEPVAKKVRRSPADDRFDMACTKVYGPVASARAAGKMSRPVALVQVLLRAPAMLAVLVAFALLYSRVGRFMLWTAAGGWYLWETGFDRFIRDFVLVHVPRDELTDVWTEYLAGPLQNLALHALVLLLLTSAMVYTQVAEAAGVPKWEPKAPAPNPARVPPAATGRNDGAVLHGVQPSPLVDQLTRQNDGHDAQS